mmetsp:Transcript_53068/g.84614  ORF Transcript_53068/g.84614 Transcript_53068/m.84614 type:complete len:286 (-) Transcript_53068:595-1452(-)
MHILSRSHRAYTRMRSTLPSSIQLRLQTNKAEISMATLTAHMFARFAVINQLAAFRTASYRRHTIHRSNRFRIRFSQYLHQILFERAIANMLLYPFITATPTESVQRFLAFFLDKIWLIAIEHMQDRLQCLLIFIFLHLVVIVFIVVWLHSEQRVDFISVNILLNVVFIVYSSWFLFFWWFGNGHSFDDALTTWHTEYALEFKFVLDILQCLDVLQSFAVFVVIFIVQTLATWTLLNVQLVLNDIACCQQFQFCVIDPFLAHGGVLFFGIGQNICNGVVFPSSVA